MDSLGRTEESAHRGQQCDRTSSRGDVLCVPNLDEQRDFDAEVRSPSGTVPVEITLAIEPSWHHRMASFLEHGLVALSGPVIVEGRGERRQYQPRWSSSTQACRWHSASGW
jgi:hypothetical protein